MSLVDFEQGVIDSRKEALGGHGFDAVEHAQEGLRVVLLPLKHQQMLLVVEGEVEQGCPQVTILGHLTRAAFLFTR